MGLSICKCQILAVLLENSFPDFFGFDPQTTVDFETLSGKPFFYKSAPRNSMFPSPSDHFEAKSPEIMLIFMFSTVLHCATFCRENMGVQYEMKNTCIFIGFAQLCTFAKIRNDHRIQQNLTFWGYKLLENSFPDFFGFAQQTTADFETLSGKPFFYKSAPRNSMFPYPIDKNDVKSHFSTIS
mgnify:CR=1 FL=1